MVDISKLSDMSGDTKEESGINIMDAIKGVTGLIKEAKGLMPKKEENNLNQPVALNKPIAVQEIKPKVNKPIETKVSEIKPKQADKVDLNQYFDKIVQALDMATMIYGDIPISQFKEVLKTDKEKIMLMVSNFM